MRGKRRAVCAILTAVLCLGLLTPLHAGAADLYFTGLNDNVIPLTSTMPFWSGGTLYVPYSVFDPRLNGSGMDIGLFSSYSRSQNTVTIFSLQQMLVFDLDTGECWDDISGEALSGRAVMRNSCPYLPLDVVCRFFGLQYSYNTIPYLSNSYLVRIKNDDVVLNDAQFIDAAGNLLRRRLREYNQSLNPVDPTPAPTPTPDPGPSTTQPEQPISPTNIPTYLAVRCESADGLTSILNTLDAAGHSAVFFFPPQLLEEEGDLVRRMLGTGYSVGILARGENAEQTRQLLERGNRALETQARTRTTLAYVPGDQRSALKSEGWVCWNETLLLSPTANSGANSFASSTMKRLNGRFRTTYLTLEGGADSARVLSTLLRRLSDEHFIINIPLETVL